jgi:hypothetical protein
MNVYQKLNEARTRLHQAKLKKSGYNKFAGYSYFELSDFLVPALQIFNEIGLCSTISFDRDYASMKIINVDKPEEVIVFTSPMSDANLKGCHPVQNLGAVETYTRRYLWVTALEIVEHDALDASEPIKEERPKASKISPVPDVELTEDQSEFAEEIRSTMVGEWLEGHEVAVLDIWYKSDMDNEIRTAVWKKLAPESKLRAFIKANKPEPVAA